MSGQKVPFAKELVYPKQSHPKLRATAWFTANTMLSDVDGVLQRFFILCLVGVRSELFSQPSR